MTKGRDGGASHWARQAAALLAKVGSAAERDDLQQRFEERAAIAEIDGQLSRQDAERQAFVAIETVIRSRRE